MSASTTNAPEALPRHLDFMGLALAEARLALGTGDVPVGAVLVAADGTILGRGHNRREERGDPIAHAEVLALQEGSRTLGHWRLLDTTLYVTLEPCVMCAGAMVQGRIGQLVYGCDDPKAGAIRSLYQLGDDARLNHRFPVVAGILGEAAAQLLRDFFSELRAKRREPELPGDGIPVPAKQVRLDRRAGYR